MKQPFFLLFLAAFISICSGDPETVDGLITSKRIDPAAKKKQSGPLRNIPLLRRGLLREQVPLERIWRSTTPTHTGTSSSSTKDVFEDINEVLTSSVPSTTSTTTGNVNEVLPVLSALSQKKSAVSFEGEEDKGSGLSALIIGIAFVAVFVGIAVSLVAIQGSFLRREGNQCGLEEEDHVRRKDLFEEDEDQTPPELRGLGSTPPSFVQPPPKDTELMSGSNETSPPFFFGKLMLNDSPTEASAEKSSKFVSVTVNSMTSMLLAAGEALSGSPGKSPDDLLVMDPKTIFGASEEECSDESSDDTVYECRGLASPGEMEVSNPFYLHGSEAFASSPEEGSRAPLPTEPLTPKPISQVPLRHQGIKGYN